MSNGNREPSWKRSQERQRRARRRLAGIVVTVFLAVLGFFVIPKLWQSAPEAPVPVSAELSAPAAAEPQEPEAAAQAAEGEAGDIEEEMEAMAVAETAETESTELWGPPDPFTRYAGLLQPGDTFGTMLDDAGVPPQVAQEAIRTLKGTLDFRRTRPGDKFELIVDADGKLSAFQYERGMNEIYRIDTSGAKWVALKEMRQFTRQLALIQGTVETTLFDAIAKVGEQDLLIMNFVEIFAWAIDFSVFTRKGDTFTMLVEKLYDQEVFRGYGRIYLAEYNNEGHIYNATYFESPDGFAGYFDAQGRNLRRAFLKAPLRFNMITSSFTRSRFHPVLKFRRPHLGIDYAAPTGTPIWSIADGVVTGAGWMGGSGRAVKIRHRNGIETSYSHLSRFAKGIRAGTRVKQKQVIGYVGSSGLATGPHLHFGMKRHGKAVNPARIDLPAGDPVPRKYLTQFQEERTKWLAEMAARLTPVSGPKVVPAAAAGN